MVKNGRLTNYPSKVIVLAQGDDDSGMGVMILTLYASSFHMKWVMLQPCWTAVESSWEENMKPPSPLMETTF
jgi:hypothetical protein